jgi:general secretion pathway protein C
MPLYARFPLDSAFRLIVIVLLAVTAVLLGRLTWTVVEPDSVLPAPASVTLSLADGSDVGATRGFSELAVLSVFGSAAGQSRNAAINAPDTSLK